MHSFAELNSQQGTLTPPSHVSTSQLCLVARSVSADVNSESVLPLTFCCLMASCYNGGTGLQRTGCQLLVNFIFTTNFKLSDMDTKPISQRTEFCVESVISYWQSFQTFVSHLVHTTFTRLESCATVRSRHDKLLMDSFHVPKQKFKHMEPLSSAPFRQTFCHTDTNTNSLFPCQCGFQLVL